MSVDAGDELVGMTRAFFYAGTPSVVSTLWQVDDESSALLMERFYIHLRNGMSKAEALRQAQIDVRQEHPNPHYWAGYVLSGDPGEPVAYSSVPWLIGGALLVLLLLAGLRIWIFIRQRKAA
jgi:hypothetical protein